MKAVASGLDSLVASRFKSLRGLRLGILANQSAVDSCFRHILNVLEREPEIQVVRLFAPEHGFAGTRQDMEHVGDGSREAGSAAAAFEVVSLYGTTEDALHPKESQFADIDVLVVDLPDIGARYYTFAQTMAYCMRVAAKTGVKVVVLDRPNPIDGRTVEGSTLLEQCRSFCGYGPIPQRHGLTLGELAELFNRGFEINAESIEAIGCNLEVVKVSGWQRSMYFDECGLPWIQPSVNMPTLDTAIVYPGMCLFEATKLSEGRGTTRPFELCGAPYIDGTAWAAEVARLDITLDGAVLRPLQFIPKFQKLQDQVCGGIQLHVLDRSRFQPLRWAIALLAAAKRLYPDDFRWRSETYEFISSVPAIDLLYGSPELRQTIESGSSLQSIEQEIAAFSKAFEEARKPFLLY